MKSIESALDSNIKKFYIYRVVSRFYLYLPIIVIIFLKQGLNYFEVGTLLAIYGLIICFLEIPSGIFADRFGSKVSMGMGEFSKALGLIILWLGTDFFSLMVGQIFSGLGYVMASGADSALLHNTFTQLKKEDHYKEHEAKSHGYIFISILLAGILGGWLTTFGLKLPLLLTAPFHALALIIVLTFTEPHIKTSSLNPQIKFSHVINFLKFNPQVRFYTFYYAIIRALILAAFVGFMPLYFFIEMDISLVFFGIILGSFTLVSFFVAKNTQKIVNGLGELKTIIVMMISLFSAFIILGFFRNQIGLLSPVLLGISAGLIRPLAFGKINELVSSEIRSTVLSSAEFLYGIFNVSILLIVSYIFFIRNISTGFNVLLCLSIFIFIIIFIGFNRYTASK